MYKSIKKYSDKIVHFGVAAIILAVPLYPKFPFLRVPGTYVSIRLEDFLILTVGLFWGIGTLFTIKEFFKNKLNRSILLYFFIGLVSVLSAIFITQTISTNIGFLHWGRRIEYMLCFFIGVSAIKSKEDLKFYLKCIGLVILYVLVYGVGQKYFNWPIITTQNDEYSKGIALRYMPGGHLVSTFAGHYDMATFLVLVLPVFYCLLFVKTLGLKIKLLITLLIISGVWLLVNTASRISIVSYMGSVTLSLLLIRKYKAILLAIILSLVVISFSSNLMDRYTRIFDVYIKSLISIKPTNLYIVNNAFAEDISAPRRREETKTPAPVSTPVFEDRSTSIRINVEWPRALRAFSKNPLLGTGFSSITLATDNDYLRSLGEVGILGFLSFGLIFLNIGLVFLKGLSSFKKLTMESSFVVGIVGAYPGVLLNAVFIDVFESSKFATLFWLLSGFAVSLIKLSKNEK